MDKGSLYIREVFSSEVVQRYLEGSPVRTSVSLYICIAPVVSSGRVMAVAVGRSLRASVSSLWPMVFDGGFRFREAYAETDGKCHRGQAREGAAGAGRTKVRAGDKGLSGSGTYAD